MLDVPQELKKDFKKLPPTARALTALALICVTFAITWISATGPYMRGTMLWVPPTAFAFLAVMFMLTAAVLSLGNKVEVIGKHAEVIGKHAETIGEDAETIGEHAETIGEDVEVIESTAAAIARQIEPAPPGIHMGCRIGRRRLECGILEVTPQNNRLPSEGLPLSQAEVTHWAGGEIRGQLSNGALLSHASHGRFQQADLYSELAAAMGKLFTRAHQKNVCIASIGISVPGGVYPDRGVFDGLVEGGPFQAGEDITQKVAMSLVQEVDAEVLNQVLGASDPEAMRAKIHLDNDARCAARWLLVENPSSQNMACVFAGSGVGAGLAFGREVFYGNHFRAGEIGHVNLNPGSLFLLDSTSGMALQPRHCSCGKEGYHFESLVGIGGLGHLAQVIDKSKLTQICDTYKADPDQGKQVEVESIDEDDANGIITLRALAYVGQRNPVFAPYTEPNPTFIKLIKDKSISDYLARVAETYARLFGTGIATLLAALDVDHVGLCGTIPEFLQNNLRFTKGVRESLDDNIPGMPGSVRLQYGDMRRWSWRGAALLARDPGYMRRRFPQNWLAGETEDRYREELGAFSSVARPHSQSNTETSTAVTTLGDTVTGRS
jgi:predicted NBD/HSP70 family sugar kinase